MTTKQLHNAFQDHYEIAITKDGTKAIYKLYSRFDEDVIEEALECCFEQYEDAQEAFDKLGGICFNKSVQYLEEL